MHDSAAHAINVILVQAGAARLLQQRDPAATRTALTTIEEVARETIGEIDQLVRGLRENGRTEDHVEPPTGLAALETLADRHRATGLDVEINVDGAVRTLARGVDQGAYRILQESLTNAARHGAGRVAIAIEYRERELALRVSNAPSSSETFEPLNPGGGHGILGMRERASLLGGTLTASRDGELFVVYARLPYTGEDER